MYYYFSRRMAKRMSNLSTAKKRAKVLLFFDMTKFFCIFLIKKDI